MKRKHPKHLSLLQRKISSITGGEAPTRRSGVLWAEQVHDPERAEGKAVRGVRGGESPRRAIQRQRRLTAAGYVTLRGV